MLNVKLERYLNTFWRKDEAKSFASLSELENWNIRPDAAGLLPQHVGYELSYAGFREKHSRGWSVGD